jgi:hypothetical protein
MYASTKSDTYLSVQMTFLSFGLWQTPVSSFCVIAAAWVMLRMWRAGCMVCKVPDARAHRDPISSDPRHSAFALFLLPGMITMSCGPVMPQRFCSLNHKQHPAYVNLLRLHLGTWPACAA